MSYPVLINENFIANIDYPSITPTIVAFVEHTMDCHLHLYGDTNLIFHGLNDFVLMTNRMVERFTRYVKFNLIRDPYRAIL